MFKLILAAFLIPLSILAQTTTYTEFYCTGTGTNVNAGSTTNDAALYTSANGDWNTTTSTFTPTDSSTPSSVVAAGDFASITLDASTTGVCVARVVSVAAGVNGAVVLSTTSRSGTAPTTAATGRTLRVGGAWKGPYAAIPHPFNFITFNTTNSIGNAVRVNLKGGYSNVISATISHNLVGPTTFQGYTNVPGDLGKAIIDAAAGAYGVLYIGGHAITVADCIIQNTSSGGGYYGLTLAGNDVALRCVANSMGGNGFHGSGSCLLIECEAYSCAKANSTGSSYGFGNNSGTMTCIRCYAHDNAGTKAAGFGAFVPTFLLNCLSVSNGFSGYYNGTAGLVSLINCDAVGNRTNGFMCLDSGVALVSGVTVENCNFIGNGNYGISLGTKPLLSGYIRNCGFGSGTATNGLGSFDTGATTLGGLYVNNITTYPTNTTPYVNFAGRNYTISGASLAAGRGMGNFTDTGYGIVMAGYPSIGAVGPITNSAAGTVAYPFQ